ncbi:MAG TPA: hypothetical protein VF399_05165 [bacterium]|jgi:hypothetical protein
MAIPKERKRYHGILDLRDKSVRNFHLNPDDFPGLSFEKASLGKIRLDQNDGTDVPLAQIPDILTGKDADTVDGLHLPNTIANLLTDHNKANHDVLGIDADSVDGYHLDQSVQKNSTPEFQNIQLKTLIGSGQLLYSKTDGELVQTPRLFWDTTNQYLDINVNKTGYDNKLMKLRNIAGSTTEPGAAIFQLESGDVSAFFRVYHGGNAGNIQMWLSSDMTEGELGFSAGGTTGIEIQPSPTTGAGMVCFGGWQNPGAAYCFNTTSYWESNGYLLAVRKSDDTYPLILKGDGKLGIGAVPTALLDINSDILRLRTSKTPASAEASGNAGDICWDSNYIYICVATDTWKRAAIAW